MATNPPPQQPGGGPGQPVPQPPTFGAPSYGAPTPQAPPPTYGAPPSQGQPPAYGAPPGGTPAGTPPPPQKKGINWGLTCLIIFIVLCCCCCGLPMAGMVRAAKTGGEFAKNFKGTPLEDVMDEFEDEMRKAMRESGQLDSNDSSWDSSSFDSSSSIDDTSMSDDGSSMDTSGESSMDDGSGDAAPMDTTGMSDSDISMADMTKLGQWVYDETLAGKTIDNESGYDSESNRAYLVYVLKENGSETRYKFFLGADAIPVPGNDEAHQLARKLGLSQQ